MKAATTVIAINGVTVLILVFITRLLTISPCSVTVGCTRSHCVDALRLCTLDENNT